jgi:hypothetical protein
MSLIGLNKGMLMTMNGLQNKGNLKDELEVDEPQREQRNLLNWRSRKRWLSVLRMILMVAAALAGNNAFRRAIVFECEDPTLGIAFEVRGNWDIEPVQRVYGSYLLYRQRFIKRPFSTIQMSAYPNDTDSFEPDRTPHDLEALMDDEVEKRRGFYDFFVLIQPTTVVERGDHRIAKATVLVGRPNDEDVVWDEEEQRLKDIYMIAAIRDDEPDHTLPFRSHRLDHNRRFALVYVTRHNSPRFNAEAEEIVNSFRFIEYNDDPHSGEYDLVCR